MPKRTLYVPASVDRQGMRGESAIIAKHHYIFPIAACSRRDCLRSARAHPLRAQVDRLKESITRLRDEHVCGSICAVELSFEAPSVLLPV
jgi:hypothetical protein